MQGSIGWMAYLELVSFGFGIELMGICGLVSSGHGG